VTSRLKFIIKATINYLVRGGKMDFEEIVERIKIDEIKLPQDPKTFLATSRDRPRRTANQNSRDYYKTEKRKRTNFCFPACL